MCACFVWKIWRGLAAFGPSVYATHILHVYILMLKTYHPRINLAAELTEIRFSTLHVEQIMKISEY